MKTYHFMVYVKPDRPIKFPAVESTSVAKAWEAFVQNNSQAISIIEGGGNSKLAIINFEGLMSRVWPRKVVLYQIGNRDEKV